MPVKRKWSVWDYPKRAVVRRDIINHTVDSHAGCLFDGQKDHHADVTNSYLEANASGQAVDWNKWISYGNSYYRCYNTCRQVEKRINRTGGGQVILSKPMIYDYTEQCYWDEDYEDLHHNSNSISITLWPHLGDWQTHFTLEKLESFEYLEGPQYAEKMRILDRIALDNMIPDLDAGIDLPVFLGELVELKMLWRQFKSKAGLLKSSDSQSPYEKILDSLKQFKDEPLRNLARSWLAFIFGWKPFVTDVKRICEGIWKFGAAAQKYSDNANKRMTLHYVKNLNPLTFKDQSWFNPVNQNITFDASDPSDPWYFARYAFKSVTLAATYTREVTPPEYHATLHFMYNVPALADGKNFYSDWLLMCAKYWRIKFSPEQVWELIPFSFVVDWFLSIGPWLEKFDEDFLDVQVIVYDYCRSVKYRQRKFVHIEPEVVSMWEPYAGYDSAEQWTCLPQSTTQYEDTECYERIAFGGGPAPPDSVINGRTPRGLQWITAGALFEVLTGRRRR